MFCVNAVRGCLKKKNKKKYLVALHAILKLDPSLSEMRVLS